MVENEFMQLDEYIRSIIILGACMHLDDYEWIHASFRFNEPSIHRALVALFNHIGWCIILHFPKQLRLTLRNSELGKVIQLYPKLSQTWIIVINNQCNSYGKMLIISIQNKVTNIGYKHRVQISDTNGLW